MKAKLVLNIGSRKRYIYRGYLIELSSKSTWFVYYEGHVVDYSTSLSRCKNIVDWRIYLGYDI